MEEFTNYQDSGGAPLPYRLDVQLHELLTEPVVRPTVPPSREPQTLPEPIFPQHPELLGDAEPDPAGREVNAPSGRHWTASRILHTMRGWLFPYIKSRVLPGDFHPIIAYLFTEWKCNLDCHYCWSFDNRVKGMTEDIA